VQLDPGASIVTFEGELEDGDGQRIIEALRNSGAGLLFISSYGGLVSEAQMVGYYLRSNNVNSMAGEVCASACVFTLAGGVKRLSLADSMIGLHRTHLEGGGGTLEMGQQLVGNYLRYFKSMGIDPEIVAIASNVASESVQWLTAEELSRLKLVTEAPVVLE